MFLCGTIYPLFIFQPPITCVNFYEHSFLNGQSYKFLVGLIQKVTISSYYTSYNFFKFLSEIAELCGVLFDHFPSVLFQLQPPTRGGGVAEPISLYPIILKFHGCHPTSISVNNLAEQKVLMKSCSFPSYYWLVSLLPYSYGNEYWH